MIIMKRFNVLFMVLCYTLCSVSAWSQHTVKGVVKDKETHPVIGASVIIRSLQDTLNHKGCITGENGQFTIEKIKSGKYRIEISFIGYTDYRQEFELDQSLDWSFYFTKKRTHTLTGISPFKFNILGLIIKSLILILPFVLSINT